MMTLLLTTLALAPLQCELSVSAESGVNDPLPLVMTLTNRGDAPRGIDLVHPLRGWFADAIDLTRDGQPLDYRGPLAKRGTPGDGDFLHLGAGEQSQADADLAQAYDLSQPGRYRLSYRAHPLTLTKGVAPSCPAIDFTRVAP